MLEPREARIWARGNASFRKPAVVKLGTGTSVAIDSNAGIGWSLHTHLLTGYEMLVVYVIKPNEFT
jgi:hypothetical protein